MSKPLRSIIGLLLLISTISLATCQSMIEVIPGEKASSTVYKSIDMRPL